MDEIGGIFSAAKWLLILGVVIAVPIFIGAAIIEFWYFSVPLIGAALAGGVYWKRQKRASNMV